MKILLHDHVGDVEYSSILKYGSANKIENIAVFWSLVLSMHCSSTFLYGFSFPVINPLALQPRKCGWVRFFHISLPGCKG